MKKEAYVPYKSQYPFLDGNGPKEEKARIPKNVYSKSRNAAYIGQGKQGQSRQYSKNYR